MFSAQKRKGAAATLAQGRRNAHPLTQSSARAFENIRKQWRPGTPRSTWWAVQEATTAGPDNVYLKYSPRARRTQKSSPPNHNSFTSSQPPFSFHSLMSRRCGTLSLSTPIHPLVQRVSLSSPSSHRLPHPRTPSSIPLYPRISRGSF